MRLTWLRTRKFDSEKNGTLVVTSHMGRPVVTVNGFFQTAPYMDVLWKKALRLIPKQTRIKHVLLLGYGAGGTNRCICRRFPGARITAIEWDPAMAALAQELKLHKPSELADLHLGDAGDVIHQLAGPFDLIIFDLYRGREPSPLIEDPTFLLRLQTLLEPDGYFLTNVFGKPQALETVAKFFSCRKKWKYRWNHCGLFRPFGCGGQGDPILPGFLPYHAIPSVMKRETEAYSKQTFLSGEGYVGRRRIMGYIGFEVYFGDGEPIIEQGNGLRFAQWQPLTRMDIPHGWQRSPLMPNYRKTGYAPIVSTEDYWKTWSPHAQRHRKKWLAKPDAEIRVVDKTTFLEAYKHGTLDRLMKRMFAWMVERKAEAHTDLMHYWLAVTPEGKAIAGLAVLDIPETKTALHVIAFHTKDSKHSSANYGLIDYWFHDAIQKGWKYLDFDVFQGPTDPRSWKGFTRFKGQFGTKFILYPNPLVKFVK